MTNEDEPENSSSKNPNRPWQNTVKPSRMVHDAYSRAANIGQQYAPMAPIVPPNAPNTPPQHGAGNMPARGRGRRRQHAPIPNDVIGPRDEIIFEFAPRGQFMQVTAMHAPSLTEVTVVGSVQASEREMEQLALAKLRFVLRKKGAGQR